METLKKIKQIDQDIEVILCGVLPTSALAISALNSGACYFLIEPFDRRNFATSLKKALTPSAVTRLLSATICLRRNPVFLPKPI